MVAWKSLSRCLGFMNKYKDAVNAYLDGVKKSERNPNTREACDIGNLFLKVGNVVQGRRWLEAALSAVAPDNLKTRRDILEGLLSVYLAQKETALLEGVVKQLDDKTKEGLTYWSQKYVKLAKANKAKEERR